ncbi:MAG: hypothetical protein QNK11_03430 [Legionella sp.]|nr:hypothetical protein [Legionella sp.]
MKKYITLLNFLILLTGINIAYAQPTVRTAELSNDKTNVWKTIVYPGSNQILKMHRHDYDRVIVALSNGLLKITNDKGEIHYLKLKKHKAYYLKKDLPHELHKDENITKHPITVMVIELKGY